MSNQVHQKLLILQKLKVKQILALLSVPVIEIYLKSADPGEKSLNMPLYIMSKYRFSFHIGIWRSEALQWSFLETL